MEEVYSFNGKAELSRAEGANEWTEGEEETFEVFSFARWVLSRTRMIYRRRSHLGVEHICRFPFHDASLLSALLA